MQSAHGVRGIMPRSHDRDYTVNARNNGDCANKMETKKDWNEGGGMRNCSEEQ